MTLEEARQLLLDHSQIEGDIDSRLWTEGFMGSLRPYRGLVQKNFDEVMEAIRVVAPQLATPTVDRELMGALWIICFNTIIWGLDPGGMLQRNNLMSPEEIKTLQRWIDDISYAVMTILETGDPSNAFPTDRSPDPSA